MVGTRELLIASTTRRGFPCRIWVCAIGLACSLVAGSVNVLAQSQKEEAARLFDSGTKAFARKEWVVAGRAFDSANRLVPHGATAYNAAKAWEAAGDGARAADDYSLALELGGLTAVQANDATRRLQTLRKGLTPVLVRAPQGSKLSVEHVAGASPPLRVHLARGSHELRVEFSDGSSATRPLEVTANPTTIEIEAPEVAPSPKPAPAKKGVSLEPRESSPGKLQRTLGWTSLGVGALGAGVAVFLGVRALAARDSFYDSDFTDRDAHDRAASLRLWTNVSWVAAGVLATTGVVLVLSAPSRENSSPPLPSSAGKGLWTLGAAPGGVILHGNW